MDFKERLENYRKEIEIEKKKDMAKMLGISESFYNLIESGARPVSKNVLRRLVIMSSKPDEYWLYGITDEKELLSKREEFKCLKDAIEQLSNIGLLKDTDEEFNSSVEEVLIAAMKADVIHILEKRKSQK